MWMSLQNFLRTNSYLITFFCVGGHRLYHRSPMKVLLVLGLHCECTMYLTGRYCQQLSCLFILVNLLGWYFLKELSERDISVLSLRWQDWLETSRAQWKRKMKDFHPEVTKKFKMADTEYWPSLDPCKRLVLCNWTAGWLTCWFPVRAVRERAIPAFSLGLLVITFSLWAVTFSSLCTHT